MVPSRRLTGSKAPSRFGRLGMTGYLTAALFIVGAVVLASGSTLRDAGVPSGLANVLLKVSLAVLGVAVILFVSVLWRLRSTRRERHLANRFTALVLTSVRSRDLTAAILALQQGGIITTLLSLPLSFSLLANTCGIEVWSGTPASPGRLFQINWGSISAVTESMTEELGRSSRGLTFTVEGFDGAVLVPFIITGAGFGGLLPLKSEEIGEIVRDLESMRVRARAHPSVGEAGQ